MENFDISSLLQNLSSQDIDRLKSIAQNVLSSNHEDSKMENHSDMKEELPSFSGLNLDPSMILKVSSLIKEYKCEDSRCTFLNSLKPLLSEDRRIRVDQAIRLIKILKLYPHVKKFGLF